MFYCTYAMVRNSLECERIMNLRMPYAMRLAALNAANLGASEKVW